MNSESTGDSRAALRSVALLAAVFGAIGSIGLLRHAQQHPPPFLAVLFVIWVLAPFGLLGLANLRSTNWPAAVRTTLYITTFIVTIASVAIYVDNNIARRTAHPAGVWVAVPPAAVIISLIAVGLAAWKVRNKNGAEK